ncbi:hypothetical protein SAY87_015155 [Trapa incisa]|uniref:Uncharacterized protein n=1 Tax=Trapa incisa TaxID=236973 RepID=A0AAN7JKU2_9MYRT|nr:hypothetical protein SAY87_015155 [Trapa incisa]
MAGKLPLISGQTQEVPKTGLRAPFQDGFLERLAHVVIKLAKEGLGRRGFKETCFLNAMAHVVRIDSEQYVLP